MSDQLCGFHINQIDYIIGIVTHFVVWKDIICIESANRQWVIRSPSTLSHRKLEWHAFLNNIRLVIQIDGTIPIVYDAVGIYVLLLAQDKSPVTVWR